MEHEGAEAWVPVTRSVAKLASAAEECRGCELWEDATQVVTTAWLRPPRTDPVK